MAITLIQSPSLIQPAYNPIYIRCSSNNTSNYGFKFVFDTYVDGVYVNRNKLLPRPGLSSTIYSPARILETYVTPDTNINMISTGQTTPYVYYEVKIGEEYGSSTTGTTIYSGLTFVSGYTFNGVLQYEEVPTWDYLDYTVASSYAISTASTASFLTNTPSSKVIRDDESELLTIFFKDNIINNIDTFISVVKYKITGGTEIQQRSIYTGISGLTGPYTIGTGIYNLNQWLTVDIDPNIHSKYTVEIVNTDVNSDYSASETKTYVIDCQPTKYGTTRFMFLNQFGQFDFFTAKLFNKKKIDIDRKTFKQTLDYNYSVGDWNEKVIDITANESHSVQSDWIDTETAEWLKELFLSTEVYVVENNTTLIPIIIETNSIDVRKTSNEKLINYTFDYRMSNKINTMRS